MKDLRRFLADAIHPHQPILRRAENRRRIAQRFQQPPHPDRPDLWQHVERDDGFLRGHGL